MSERVRANRIIALSKLRPHPRNFRSHPEAQIAKLAQSYRRFGQFRSIVAVEQSSDEYLIIAGHGFVEAMTREGATEARVDLLDPNTDSATLEAILVADNLHSQGAIDDETMLAQLLQEQQDLGMPLATLGTDEETLRQMLDTLGDEVLSQGEAEEGNEGDEGEGEQAAGGDEFDATPDEQQTRCKLGDVWALGRHRIVCADSTDPSVFNKLCGNTKISMIFADPPYGVKERTLRKTAGRSKLAECNDFLPVIGDDRPFDPSFLLSLPANVRIIWGANYFAHKLQEVPSWIVWDKRDGIPSNDNADCELAWTDKRGPARLFVHRWNGMIKASEWGERRVHPTQKPVKLAEFCFERYGNGDDVIFDPFLGSGISIIAAENMGDRTVYGCELSPDYINVVISRWEAHTGKTAELLERTESSV